MKRSGGIDNSDGGDRLLPHRPSSRQSELTPSTQTTEPQPQAITVEQETKTNEKTTHREKQNVLRLARGNTLEELEESTQQNTTVQERQKGVRLSELGAAPQVHRQRQQRGPRPLLPQDSVDDPYERLEHRYEEEVLRQFQVPATTGASSHDENNGTDNNSEAEPVQGSVDDGYERLERRVEEEVPRQFQVPAPAAASGNDENNGTNNNSTFHDGGTSQPVLATVLGTEEGNGQGDRSRCTKILTITAPIGVIGGVILVIIIFLSINSNDNNSGMPTESPSLSPTKAPTTSPTMTPAPSIRPTTTPATKLQHIASIVGVENLDSLSTTSPEFQALEWMAFEDPLYDELLVTTSDESNRILPERYSIVVFYYATNGTSWFDQNSFLSGTSVCDWKNGFKGIYCNGEGMVNGIVLDESGLLGTIPPQLGELLFLESLNLRFNNLRGTIPDALSGLTQLTFLTIWENRLTGTIPASLSGLTNLEWLDVDVNKFTGTIPDALAALTQLSTLGLRTNMLTGTIPSALGALTKLTYLSVSSNQLTGTFPLAFQSLTALRELYLYNNLLTGNLDLIFCPRPSTLVEIGADCREPDPEITCSCCTICF